MEKHEELIKDANKLINTADHFIYTTYPMLKETKLLLTIVKNIHDASVKAMDSVLEYERLYKRISDYPDDFNTKLEILKTKCMRKYSLPREFIQTIRDVRMIVKEHKQSPIEFSRYDKLIICSEDFRTKSISLTEVKGYLSTAKPFIQKTNRVVLRR